MNIISFFFSIKESFHEDKIDTVEMILSSIHKVKDRIVT